jgi:hypothetical protein
MSTNITSVETRSFDPWMTSRDVVRLLHEHRDELPECCFLEDVEAEAVMSLAGDSRVSLPSLDWYGGGSGYSLPLLLEIIAPFIHGRVEAIFTWEGGEEATGVIVLDGKVTECDVVQTLVPKEAKSTP